MASLLGTGLAGSACVDADEHTRDEFSARHPARMKQPRQLSAHVDAAGAVTPPDLRINGSADEESLRPGSAQAEAFVFRSPEEGSASS
jgi:hypothetical protein